jgi:hypothetical protein
MASKAAAVRQPIFIAALAADEAKKIDPRARVHARQCWRGELLVGVRLASQARAAGVSDSKSTSRDDCHIGPARARLGSRHRIQTRVQELPMTKFFSLVLAAALLAPVAFATLNQASLIVA